MRYYVNSIRWRLAFSYAAIALLAAFSLGLVLRTVLRNYYDGQEERYLQSRAIEIGSIASQLFDAGLPPSVIQDLSKSWSFILQSRVQVLDATRHKVADSGVPVPQKVFFLASEQPFEGPLGQSVTRPAIEIVDGPGTLQIQVLRSDGSAGVAGQKDVIIFNRESVGVALPADVTMNGLLDPALGSPARRSSQVVEHPIIGPSGNLLGKVILSDGPAYGDEILNNVMSGWLAASIIAVVLAALAGWYFSNRITTPITALTQITSRMAAGDLSARADVLSTDEMGMLGQSFNGMAEQVEQTVSTLRAFIADAAHELHTPLTALQTNLELADVEDASARSLYLSRAQAQSRRLEALVKSLLDLSRIESARMQHDLAPLDLNQLVSEVSEQFASRAEQANRPFNLDVPGEKIMVNANEMQMKQVLANLLENALKFTPENGSITLTLQHMGEDALLTVTDTGIGILPEDLPHMFERFHRGRNASEYPGNGLGLAIVKAIVESSSGRVEAQSKGVGLGSMFSVRLPVRH